MQRFCHSKTWIQHGLAALLWTAVSVAQAGIITQWTTTGSSAPASGPRTFSSGGEVLRAWAYSTEYENGTGVFNPAKLGLYSGGLGVKNNYPDDNVSGDSKREAVSPYHAVDNHRHVDLVIFEFPDDHYSPLSFEIGYKSKDADIHVWFGGAALGPGFDFSGQSFAHPGVSGLFGLLVFHQRAGQYASTPYGRRPRPLPGDCCRPENQHQRLGRLQNQPSDRRAS
ncbi:MAG: hypothetical protein KatS3mg123_3373 [Burkholderiales bacterium]|nr:MAG: hypothetical protein KatS3mg123_3373 [Burkholderiales bacterium]